jgi:hypothetical protein
MYTVERSVVALTREVGIVDGRTTLEVRGSVGTDGTGKVVLSVVSVRLGRSHAVCCSSVTSFSPTAINEYAPCWYQPGTSSSTPCS